MCVYMCCVCIYICALCVYICAVCAYIYICAVCVEAVCVCMVCSLAVCIGIHIGCVRICVIRMLQTDKALVLIDTGNMHIYRLCTYMCHTYAANRQSPRTH